MRRRQSGGYIGFIIFFLLINIVPTIFRALTANSGGLAEISFDVGSLTKYLGRGAIVAVVLYFVWAEISQNARSIDVDDE